VSDSQVLAYLKTYRDYKRAEQRAFDLIERGQRCAGQLKAWKEAGGKGAFAADVREWPGPADLKTASDALVAAGQAMQRCWGCVSDEERGGLQVPYS
jgi:hypothetical protein